MDNKTEFIPPSDEEITRVFTTFFGDTICQGSMQWTAWNSASDATTGNDFEILSDHIKFFK